MFHVFQSWFRERPHPQIHYIEGIEIEIPSLNIFNFRLQLKMYGLGCCWIVVDCVGIPSNMATCSGAEDSGKAESAPLLLHEQPSLYLSRWRLQMILIEHYFFHFLYLTAYKLRLDLTRAIILRKLVQCREVWMLSASFVLLKIASK